MNIYDHCRLSKRKFGGQELDYYKIHQFIDSSKLFYYNAKHRLLLHNLYGIKLTTIKFNDFIVNSDQQTILIRDIAAEHCKEDLSGKVPSLYDWLSHIDNNEKIEIPKFEDKELESFVLKPFFRSNLKSALHLTLSNFGVYLTKEILGLEKAKILQNHIQPNAIIENFLKKYQYNANWQFTPCRKELKWLKDNFYNQK